MSVPETPLLEQLVSGQQQMLAEQRKTNELLVLLIEALADEQDPDEAAATHYLDGTPMAES
ncbi:hypothetical protein CVH10_17200 [Halomonas sp. ND22Bw]|uniref:hypothetical protein n=1 Tax=Halomonas sp. ND22Bw TaxID=2054178 RepID=UPI000D0B7F3E|nr:hypothetical protein CVH10_17200 [Halomonas sp. ND22Bw]